MSFIDLSFPNDVAANVRRGLMRKTDIVTLVNGEERRNARWRNSLRRYNAGSGIRDLDDFQAVIDLFEETEGPLHSFRFRDWVDYSSTQGKNAPTALDQIVGEGDGTTKEFQLIKNYGQITKYQRKITKPCLDSIRIAVDGENLAQGWSANPLNGIVSFSSAPEVGVTITSGYLFDVPVRFASEQIDVDLSFFSTSENRGLAQAPEIELWEVSE